MGTITDLDETTGGSGVSSYNDLTDKPVTTVVETITVSETNVITHNIGSVKSQTVVDITVYDSGVEIPVSNWTIIDANSVNIPSSLLITDATIEFQCK